MAHCMPLLDRPRSASILGAAIETMVWSMNVIATAKIIAVRIRLLDRPPVPAVLLTLIVPSQLTAQSGHGQSLRMGEVAGHQSNDYSWASAVLGLVGAMAIRTIVAIACAQ